MPPGLHAVLSASSSKRWLSCPPSARLEEKLKGIFGEKSSPYAAAGTQAHAAAELKLRHSLGELNDFNYNAQREQLGPMDRSYELAVDTYCDEVLSRYYTAQKIDPGAVLLLEQRLDFSPWVPSGFGTGDAVIISDKTLEVMDAKFGSGVRIVAQGNTQARLYGLGAINVFGLLYDFTHVRNTIIQPRVNEDPVTEETLTREELEAWGESIRPAAELAWKGLGEYKPGDHCKFCAARALCAARAAEAMRGFTHGFATPGLIDDADIPGILEVADIAESWIRDVRAYARNQALRGQQWPGWKLVRGRKGNRAWKDEEAVREQLIRAGYTEEQYAVHKLRPPGEIEKELGKQAFSALVAKYVTQAEGALNLVPESDKRIEFAAADADFSDMAGSAEDRPAGEFGTE